MLKYDGTSNIGGYLGIFNTRDIFSFEFDIYYNSEKQDPYDSHISCFANISNRCYNNHNSLSELTQAVKYALFMRHTVELKYINKCFYLTLDNSLVLKVKNVVLPLAIKSKEAALGVTASSGDAVMSLKIKNYKLLIGREYMKAERLISSVIVG